MAGIRQLAISFSSPLGMLLMVSDTAPGKKRKGERESRNVNSLPLLVSSFTQIIHLINSSNYNNNKNYR